MIHTKHLLDQVSSISAKYEEIARITGQNFNIFRLLKLSTAENRTHSAFIADLLNPKGSHDQGDVFLRLFIEELKNTVSDDQLKVLENFACPNVHLKPEKDIGPISDDWERGGRIDIFISETTGKAIAIENKIYAGDQYKQLLRYYNYCRSRHKNQFVLLFLTLEGGEPDSSSTTSDIKEQSLTQADFHLISYKHFITKWLARCREKALDHNYLRETLAQYINLIKYLTNQTSQTDMKNEIIKAMTAKPEAIKASFTIAGNFEAMKDQIMKDHFFEQLREIAEEKQMELLIKEGNTYVTNWGFYFYKKEWKYFWLGFSFASNHNGFSYGICRISENSEIPSDVMDKAHNLSWSHNRWWPAWKYCEKTNWQMNEFYEIMYTDTIKEYVKEKLEHLTRISEELEM